MWFVYDIDSGFDIFENEDEANVWLKKKLEEYREDAVGEEWNVDVESLCMGRVTKTVTLVPVESGEDPDEYGVGEFCEAIVEDVNE
jgi:hypothetical protein